MEKRYGSGSEKTMQDSLQMKDPVVSQEQNMYSDDLRLNRQLQRIEDRAQNEGSLTEIIHEAQKMTQEKEFVPGQDSMQKSEGIETILQECRKLTEVNAMLLQKDRLEDISSIPSKNIIKIPIKPKVETRHKECKLFTEGELFEINRNTAVQEGAETSPSILLLPNQDPIEITQEGKEMIRQEYKVIVDEHLKPKSVTNLQETFEKIISISVEKPIQTAEQKFNEVDQPISDRTKANARSIREITSHPETSTHLLVHLQEHVSTETSNCALVHSSPLQELPETSTRLFVHPRPLNEPTSSPETFTQMLQHCRRFQESTSGPETSNHVFGNSRLSHGLPSGVDAFNQVLVHPRPLDESMSGPVNEKPCVYEKAQHLEKKSVASSVSSSRHCHNPRAQVLQFQRLPPVPEEDLPSTSFENSEDCPGMAVETSEPQFQRNVGTLGVRLPSLPTDRRDYLLRIREREIPPERRAIYEELRTRCIKLFYGLVAGGILAVALYYLIDFLERKYDPGYYNVTSTFTNFHLNSCIPMDSFKPDTLMTDFDVSVTAPSYDEVNINSKRMDVNSNTRTTDGRNNTANCDLDPKVNAISSRTDPKVNSLKIDLETNTTSRRINLDANNTTTLRMDLNGDISSPKMDLDANTIQRMDLGANNATILRMDLNGNNSSPKMDLDAKTIAKMDLGANTTTPMVDMAVNIIMQRKHITTSKTKLMLTQPALRKSTRMLTPTLRRCN